MDIAWLPLWTAIVGVVGGVAGGFVTSWMSARSEAAKRRESRQEQWLDACANLVATARRAQTHFEWQATAERPDLGQELALVRLLAIGEVARAAQAYVDACVNSRGQDIDNEEQVFIKAAQRGMGGALGK